VGIVTTNGASYGRTNEVLGDVDLDHGLRSGLEDALDNIAGEDSFSNNGLATTLNPINCRGFLVSADVTRECNDLERGELAKQEHEGLVGTLADHVHTHAITGSGGEAEEEVATNNSGLDALKASIVRGAVEGSLDLVNVLLNPGCNLSALYCGRGGEHRTTRHAISEQSGGAATGASNGLATTSGRRNESTLSGSHGKEVLLTVDKDGTSNTNWDLNGADDVFAALADNLTVVVVLVLEGIKHARSLEAVLDENAAKTDGSLQVTQVVLHGEETHFTSLQSGNNFVVREVGEGSLLLLTSCCGGNVRLSRRGCGAEASQALDFQLDFIRIRIITMHVCMASEVITINVVIGVDDVDGTAKLK